MLKVNGSAYSYDQLRIRIERLNLPYWLFRQQIYPKVYWLDRDTRAEHAALGSILCLKEVPRFDGTPLENVRFYGGMHFPIDKQEAIWEEFPLCAFWLPSVEVVQTDTSTELTLHFLNEKASDAMIERLNGECTPIQRTPLYLLERKDLVSLDQWKKHIAHLLDAMKTKTVKKVVLARKAELHFSQALCAWEMVQKLKEKAQASTLFTFQLSPEAAFLGASPEKLFHRKKDRLFIDAVAGTRKRGKDPAEDLLLEKELRFHPKERDEFNSVKEFINGAMRPFAKEHTWFEQDQILKTAHVQHLYNQACILLKNHTFDDDLISALHPTPAVGGFPRDTAHKLILELEPFQRGWYAGPVGWISPEETSLAVAIRSGLIVGSALHLFAGAGIVAESSAEKEWEEIDHKMRLLLDLLL